MSQDGFLKVEGLRLHFRTSMGPVQAVDGVSFALGKGRTLTVVGESGCGKSSLAKAILRLLPRNVLSYEGRIVLGELDTMSLSEERFRREVRWTRIALVPQAAQNALNPVIKVAEQIAEPLLVHRKGMSKEAAFEKAKEAAKIVGIPVDFLERYPFELSGGMRQRVTIAMALVTQPDLVVLDEPTSALDVLTQANLMNVLKRIKREYGTTFILITHDIGTASELADDVAVMYAGQMVEFAPAERFYGSPRHPYSQKLMASVPTLREDKALEFIPGKPPSLIDPPNGCRFADRCPMRFAKCDAEPPTVQIEPGQFVKCWLYEEGYHG